MPRSLWAAGPLDRLARILNIPTVVDECDVLLAVVSRYVSLRVEGKVCSLALFGNFTYAELHPKETLLSPLCLRWHPRELDVQNLRSRQVNAASGGLPAR